MKNQKIIFWVTTIIIFLMEGVMPAFTSQTEMAKEGIKHLGYPEYFGNALVVFKVVGALLLIIPQVPKTNKRMGVCRFCLRLYFCKHQSFRRGWFKFPIVFPINYFGDFACFLLFLSSIKFSFNPF